MAQTVQHTENKTTWANMQKQYDKWITRHAMCLDWRKYHLTACIVGQRGLWQMSSDDFRTTCTSSTPCHWHFLNLHRCCRLHSPTHHRLIIRGREGNVTKLKILCVFKNWCEKRKKKKCSTMEVFFAHFLILEMHLWTGRCCSDRSEWYQRSGIVWYLLEKTRAACKKQKD